MFHQGVEVDIMNVGQLIELQLKDLDKGRRVDIVVAGVRDMSNILFKILLRVFAFALAGLSDSTREALGPLEGAWRPERGIAISKQSQQIAYVARVGRL
jgi:hypothetical protein